MNTLFSYLYRDASNYKQYEDIILEGTLNQEEINQIHAKLDNKEFFIPAQVGLENLQTRMMHFPSEDDHIWHELTSIVLTEDAPNTPITAEELLSNFNNVKKWDVSKYSQELGIAEN